MISPCLKCDYKDLAGVLLTFVFLLIVYTQPSQMVFSRSMDKVMLDFQIFSTNKSLNDILDIRYEPQRDGKSIFFIVTSDNSDKIVHLTPRQSCSVEAAGELKNKQKR